MGKEERTKFIETLKKTQKELSKSKEASKKFLVDTGIITEKGNLKKPYKHLCIPSDQD